MDQLANARSSSEMLLTVSNSRRYHILDLLQDRNSPVDLPELATHVLAEEQEKALFEVGGYDVKKTIPALTHEHLPRLEKTGLLEWDRPRGSVTATALGGRLKNTLDRVIDADVRGWDRVLATLAHDRRHAILSVLADHDGAIERRELAEQVANHQGSDRPQATIEDLQVELYHVHLPKLKSAELIADAPEEATVAFEGHPALNDEWQEVNLEEPTDASLHPEEQQDGVWTIEGRENVVARGQSLFEKADDELFLMFTTDGLLEEGCITRLQDAIDRGVDVYLGSQTQEVRDLVRERVPEAVIWEPQMDWLNLPAEYEKVGRLVFADREAIMLATLGEETETGVHAETAVTGGGEDNPLAVLMRDMLGSRLDHLDAQSEDFLAEIPL